MAARPVGEPRAGSATCWRRRATGRGRSPPTARVSTIREALAERDPANAEWQRDLIVSNVKLSEVTGDNAFTRRALEVAERMRATEHPAATRCLDGRGFAAASGTMTIASRQQLLACDLEILRSLRNAGRLLPNQDWVQWFEKALRDLDDAGSRP